MSPTESPVESGVGFGKISTGRKHDSIEISIDWSLDVFVIQDVAAGK